MQAETVTGVQHLTYGVVILSEAKYLLFLRDGRSFLHLRVRSEAPAGCPTSRRCCEKWEMLFLKPAPEACSLQLPLLLPRHPQLIILINPAAVPDAQNLHRLVCGAPLGHEIFAGLMSRCT